MNLKRAAMIIIPIILLGVALGLGVYFMFFRNTKKEGWSKYVLRKWDAASNSWKCPEGTKDMGDKWNPDKNWDRQCKVSKGSKFVAFIQEWGQSENSETCPKGYFKTGKSGNRACQKNDGEW